MVLNTFMTEARPHIVLILADDLGFSDLGCTGSEIRTPNLDALAAGGVLFTHFYSAARCCPTRASLLTGLYPHQVGMGGMVNGDGRPNSPYQGWLNDRCVTLAEVLAEAGYATYMSGKWHVGEEHPHWPMDRGFQRHFGLISGAMNYFDIRKDKAPGVRRRFSKENQDYTPAPDGFYSTDAFTDYAVDCIRQHKGPNPFFLYLAYNAPHWPLQAWPEDIARYEGRYREGWAVLRRERYERLLALGLIQPEWGLSRPDEQAADWKSLDAKTKALMARKMAVYAAQVDRMDQGIGRVVAALTARGFLEQTLILFLSDNGACHEGGPLGFDRDHGAGGELGGVDSFQSYGLSWSNASNTPFRRHKHWVHEGGIATPLIAHWPARIAAGGLVHDVGHVMDLMPTFCELAGATYPTEYRGRAIQPVEGRSLVPLFEGRGREPPPLLYWAHEGNHAIRAGRWKLVMEKHGPWELYDMESDRCEQHNLAADQPARVAALRAQFEAWAHRMGVRDYR